jgi:endonuclease/exonuclease/phosphatase family metal-dependent hydrolase
MGKRATKKGIGLIGSILWLVNIVIATALLGAYLSAYVNPSITTVFAFLGLAYPFLLVSNILFLLWWLIRGRKKLLLSLIVILIGYNPLITYVQIMPGREAPKDSQVIKLLSYNVQNMAHSNIGRRDDNIRNKIYGFIGSQSADIACIQEFSANSNNADLVFGELKSLTHFEECFFTNYNPKRSHRLDALVILSNLPYHNSGALSIPGDHHNFGIFIDIILGEDTIRVYNLHLKSIQFQHEDYQFVEDVAKGQTETGAFSEGSKSILRKLHNAYQVRAEQTAIVLESLDNCPYEVIICGDFNDTPLSYAYHKISSGLEDSFVNAGYGLGNTFSGKLPPIRIDFIFHPSKYKSYDFEVLKTQLSDHYPVSVYLGI